MRGCHWLMGWVLLGVGWPGLMVGQNVDMEEVRRRAEKYEREAAEEAAKKAPAPKLQPKPAPAPKPQPKPAPRVDHDREAWQSAEKCGTAACFEAYLEEYPKGRYARMAKARLKAATEPLTQPASAETVSDSNQAVAALLDSAAKYVKSNQLDKAGAVLERALQIEPRNAGILHDLAQIRLHQGQYHQAESLAIKSNSLAGGNWSLQSRNWKVVASARKAAGNTAGAKDAAFWGGSLAPVQEREESP
ncbi:MAG: tetratricopeptide repeat protein [Candidatus Contendobacter sp.]|nr:tetratricopeptide repeat protein [Candidatus Contendobacter sp.]